MQIKGRRFLVTGGSGFIGSHVVDQLLASQAESVTVFDKQVRRENLAKALTTERVSILDADVTSLEALEGALQGINGNFHLAVLPIGPERSRSAARTRRERRRHVQRVRGSAQQAGGEKVVYSSASSVYGDTNETMDESHPLEAGRSMYGASKIAGEYFLRAFREIYGLDYVTLRYMNVYGPRQEGGLIVSVLRRIESGQPPVIQGDGSASFDFVHVADVAAAERLRNGLGAQTGKRSTSAAAARLAVREVVEMLIALTGSELEPEYDLDAKVLMARRVGSNDRAVTGARLAAGAATSRRGLAEVIAFERARAGSGV